MKSLKTIFGVMRVDRVNYDSVRKRHGNELIMTDTADQGILKCLGHL